MMAMTFKSEIKVKDIDHDGNPIFVIGRKRKLQQFNDKARTDMLVFEGWDIPLKCDSDQEGNYTMRGNACYNFLGDVKTIRDYIENNNINEFFNRFDAILACEPGTNNGATEIPVFPEVPTTHAVVIRVRKANNMNKAPKVIYSYEREQAIEDGVLMKNPLRHIFNECDIITCNLMEYATNRVLENGLILTEPLDLIGRLLKEAREKYENEDFDGDNDKNFFVIKGNEQTKDVWFVRNEGGFLTAMLPEDY